MLLGMKGEFKTEKILFSIVSFKLINFRFSADFFADKTGCLGFTGVRKP